MGIVRVTDQDGLVHDLEALDGWRVMEIIRDWGLKIEGQCGGACECATCHVLVDPAWADRVPPRSEDEEDKLDTLPRVYPNSRLACQILWNEDLDGLAVTLVPETGAPVGMEVREVEGV